MSTQKDGREGMCWNKSSADGGLSWDWRSVLMTGSHLMTVISINKLKSSVLAVLMLALSLNLTRTLSGCVVADVQQVEWLTVHPLRAVQRVRTSFLSRAAYSASIPSASGAREKTIWDSRQRASSSWCCFSAQSHGVSRFSFSANKSASLCTSN